MRIKTKLLISYFLILIIGFSISALSFNFISKRFLFRETQQGLKEEATQIAGYLSNVPLSSSDLLSIISARRQFKVAGKFLDSRVVVLDKDRRIIFTNMELSDRKKVQELLTLERGKSSDFVFERKRIVDTRGNVKGYVFLFSRVKDIDKLNILMRRTLIISLVVAAAAALLVSLILGSSLTRPIEQLTKSMKNFSLKKDIYCPKVRTGDEIEELSISFEQLAAKLKRYDEKQKSFLQNTSHELKTPLMSIQGYAEAIKDGIVDGEEMEESLDIIIGESQRLKKVVDEIIYLTRLESVEEIIELRDNNFKAVITEAVKSVKPLAAEKGVTIGVKGEADFTACFDFEKLKRAFINILGNCIRYAEGAVEIIVERKASGITVEIRDDGPGFKDGEEKKIFDRFYKGNNGGTGLGLAITKAVIEGHQGTICAFNGSPGGAVFKVFLPLSGDHVQS